MDCREAESAVAQAGEILLAYHGAEAILLADYEPKKKTILSHEFTVLPFQA